MNAALRTGGTASTAGAPPLALALRNISKRFAAVQANDDVSFDISGGSIHAVVGENGAGKTTLMRIVYGLYPPDSGHIELNGVRAEFKSPRDALALGVGMVHQHSLLLNRLTVAENVMLALPGAGIPRHRDVHRQLREISEQNDLHVDPRASVASLSVGSRQRAEILSALFHGARLLILDEPTTVLTPQEVSQLFAVLDRLHDAGTTIVIVTHKLVEVMAISDHVTVLRAGRVVETMETASTDQRTLVQLMVGRDVPAHARDRAKDQAQAENGAAPVLSLHEVHVRDAAGIERVRGVGFEVAPGEIVAVTGVEGNGQRELTDAIVGLLPLSGGTIRLGSDAVDRWSVARRRNGGLSYIPEERMVEAISALDSVADNLVLGRHAQRPFARFGIRNLKATGRLARDLIGEYNIMVPSADSAAATLSGGNLQKLVVAREISKQPRVLVASQPTQGVDVAAAHMIRSTLVSLRDRGVAVLLFSSDLSEVCDIADRAVVLYNGAVYGVLGAHELTEEAIGYFAMGCPPDVEVPA